MTTAKEIFDLIESEDDTEIERILDDESLVNIAEDEEFNLMSSLYLLTINDKNNLTRKLIAKIDVSSFASDDAHYEALWTVVNPRSNNLGAENSSYISLKAMIDVGFKVESLNQGRDVFSESAKQAGGHPQTDAAILIALLETGRVSGFKENYAEIVSDLQATPIKTLTILKEIEHDHSKKIEERASKYIKAKAKHLSLEPASAKEEFHTLVSSRNRDSAVSPYGEFDLEEKPSPSTKALVGNTRKKPSPVQNKKDAGGCCSIS